VLSALRQRVQAGAQSGFTLVELCVAMAVGTIVIIGLFSILIVVLHQTQRTFTRVSATRQARIAFSNIENELHSACVDGSPPIQTGSTATSAQFVSYYGDAANPTPVWHVLTFNAAAGTLTDSTYNVSGTGPDWTEGTLVSTNTLLSNAAQDGTTPVFQYYAYTAEYTDGAGNVYWIVPDGTNLAPGETGTPVNAPLSASGTGLSATNANNTVEVVINLLVGASGDGLAKPSLSSVDDPVTDTISLRLTTPPDYVPSGAAAEGYGPCQ
jgi:prepilin-type N-terminal cleavage/methylation domain-containing protein